MSQLNKLEGLKRVNAEKNRDKSGKFQPGNPGGPGRPKKEREQAYLDATISAVSIADWIEIVKTAVTYAKEGSPSARNWLANYLIGRPDEKLDITGNTPIIILRFADIEDNGGIGSE